MSIPIVLIGGGGHCKSVIEAIKSTGREILGILDLPENIGKKILDYYVIGTDDDISIFSKKAEFIVSLGFIEDPMIRIKLHEKIIRNGGNLATIIASSAHVSEYAEIGKGSIVLHNACVNASAKIGIGVIINTSSNVEHDVIIGDYSHISTGVMVNGNCRVGNCTFIGSNSVLKNGINITEHCVIGAGSIVLKDIFEPGKYYGNPIRKI